MNWKSFFSLSKNMNPDEARAFMKEKQEEEYQLLDVRQPKEYEREHIPGAILIPVKELVYRIAELDPGKPTLVYCAAGVRSKAASQILMSRDFAEVYNISGGIRAWKSNTARGHESMGMEFFTGGDYKNDFTMAYIMEEGLQQLYQALADRSEKEEHRELLLKLASFEDRHKAKLVEDFKPEDADIPKPENIGNIMEGGFNRHSILEHFSPHLYDLEDILDLAMMLETQAYDLYSRMARKSDNEKNRDLFLHLANEENAHMEFVARELDRVLEAKS